MEALGSKLRRQRRRLGLTLKELARRSDISKPYLSLIETGRMSNPPSDEKLRRLEEALAFASGELLTQAHLERTPSDVRAVLRKLIAAAPHDRAAKPSTRTHNSAGSDSEDVALYGMLQTLAAKTAGNDGEATTPALPILDCTQNGYPRDFVDLAYPRRVASEFVSCPGVADADAFGARVRGDDMTPRYAEGDIVIFSPAAPRCDGADCFVCFNDGQTAFQRVFFEKGKDGMPMLRLQPRNERYRPRILAAKKIAGLYRAVARYQRVDQE